MSEKYILVREQETIEVLAGREDRRDKLIQAGYEWVNEPKASKPATSQKASKKAEAGDNDDEE